jgi:hypothetical protein
MSVFEMRADGVRVAIDLSVGHIADLAIERGGRVIRPLHRAPWVDGGEALPEGLPANVARLSGDFFCAPFSRNDVEDGPPHGWTANGEWQVIKEQGLADGVSARLRLRRPVMGATVEKIVTLRDGHPFVYQEHLLHGGHGALPVAHHTMVRMAQGGRIAFSPKRAALTPDTALETDPARGRSLFAYPARTADITRMPLADGGSADLTQYPPGHRHEDFVTLVEAPHGGLGFTAIARNAERDLVLVLKNPDILPVTMLWYSNGGRDYAPWSGRHTGVLGIEDGISAIGHRQSLGDNPVRREGVPTALELDPAGSVSIRQVIGWAAVTEPPLSIRAAPGSLLLETGDGEPVALPFDEGFLAPVAGASAAR